MIWLLQFFGFHAVGSVRGITTITSDLGRPMWTEVATFLLMESPAGWRVALRRGQHPMGIGSRHYQETLAAVAEWKAGGPLPPPA